MNRAKDAQEAMKQPIYDMIYNGTGDMPLLPPRDHAFGDQSLVLSLETVKDKKIALKTAEDRHNRAIAKEKRVEKRIEKMPSIKQMAYKIDAFTKAGRLLSYTERGRAGF